MPFQCFITDLAMHVIIAALALVLMSPALAWLFLCSLRDGVTSSAAIAQRRTTPKE